LSHPVERIRGTYSSSLAGRCVVLGITGSVAAYKALDTARWLIRRGADVRVVMTNVASELIGPKLVQWATGNTPVVELSGDVEHIGLTWDCDSMLIAPATLSTMAKVAYGITDNPVSVTAVSMHGQGKPLVIVPAMHGSMMGSRQFSVVRAQLERMGVTVVPPIVEEDVAKYPDPLLIARITASVTLRGRDLKGKRVLVTAGATREWIDEVRFITNASSGSMGIEAAIEAHSRGADVDLVHGPSVEPPHVIRSYRAETTDDMARIVSRLTEAGEYDAIIAAAAPLDFKPEKRLAGKLKSGVEMDVRLVPTQKVISAIRRRPKVMIAFAAEVTEDRDALLEAAKAKLEKYSADLIVANTVGASDVGFSSRYLKAVLVERKTHKYLDKVLKEDVARMLLDYVFEKTRE